MKWSIRLAFTIATSLLAACGQSEAPSKPAPIRLETSTVESVYPLVDGGAYFISYPQDPSVDTKQLWYVRGKTAIKVHEVYDSTSLDSPSPVNPADSLSAMLSAERERVRKLEKELRQCEDK